MTSGRDSTGKNANTSAATSDSKTERIIAVTCGCSPRIISAIARASIHCKISKPRLARLGMMRDSTDAALSGPSARFKTVSTYSIVPNERLVCFFSVSTN